MTTDKDREIRNAISEYYIKRNDNECWNWIGRKWMGYGIFTFKGRKWRAHRLMWELSGHNLTDGLVLDHLCRNRGCVNPAHLREVTISENVLCGEGITAKNKIKTFCEHGHELNDENIILRKDKSGKVWRRCKICKYISDKKSRYKNKETRDAHDARIRSAAKAEALRDAAENAVDWVHQEYPKQDDPVRQQAIDDSLRAAVLADEPNKEKDV